MIGANTLQEFVVARQTEFAGATGDLSRLLTDIGTAAKMVNRHINRAGLSGILGAHTPDGNGSTNVQGEAQQKLDVYADNTFHRVLRSCLKVGGIVSEEQPGILHVDHRGRGQGKGYGKYVVCIDPLDGSSNIDVNISVGTIFGIHRRRPPPDGARRHGGLPGARQGPRRRWLRPLWQLHDDGLLHGMSRQWLHLRPLHRGVLTLPP